MGSIQTELGVSSQHIAPWEPKNKRAIKLDLGCGGKKRNDSRFIGIDKFKHSDDVDIVRDIDNRGISFGDETVDLVYASHFLEHLDNLIFVVEEVWRVLKPDGIFEIISPQGDMAEMHPDHKRTIHPGIWGFWNPVTNNPEWDSLGVKARFKQIENREEGQGLFTTLQTIKTKPSLHARLELCSTRDHPIDLNNPKSIKLDLGCGSKKRSDLPGWVGVDNFSYEGVNIVRDIERGLPFGDNSVDHVYASHFLEHLNDLNFAMFEIWRVMKPSAVFDIISPLWTTKYAYAHPDHKRLIHPDLWAWWKPSTDKRDTEAYGEKAEFQILRNYEEGEGLFTRLVAIKY